MLHSTHSTIWVHFRPENQKFRLVLLEVSNTLLTALGVGGDERKCSYCPEAVRTGQIGVEIVAVVAINSIDQSTSSARNIVFQ